MKMANSKETVSFSTPTGKITRMDKIKRYGWELQDKPGKLMFIDKEDLEVDPEYQRSHSQIRVNAMASNWSHIACGALTVGFREGKYFIIEGNHRRLAAGVRSDITKLPCIVFDTDSVKEEARGFLNANVMRSPVKMMSTYKARLTAEDEDSLYLEKLFKDLGMRAGTNHRPKEVNCIGTCFQLMKANRLRFEQTMKFMAELCKDEPITMILLQGIYYLNMHLANGDLDNKRLRDKLLEVGAIKLTKAAQRSAAYYASGGAKVWATGMLQDINKRLRDKFKFSEEE